MCKRAHDIILRFLASDAVVAAPDLAGPQPMPSTRPYVICTDASKVAAGGVLLQWHQRWPVKGNGPPPPEGVLVPLRRHKKQT